MLCTDLRHLSGIIFVGLELHTLEISLSTPGYLEFMLKSIQEEVFETAHLQSEHLFLVVTLNVHFLNLYVVTYYCYN